MLKKIKLKKKKQGGEEVDESNSMTSSQFTHGDSHVVQHTRKRIYNQKRKWDSA